MTAPLLVIATFPQKGETHSRTTVGGASYTKALLTQISTQSHHPITVWAEQLTTVETYTDTKLRVSRIWKRGNWLSLLRLAAMITRAKQDNIFLSFEGYMFGSALQAIPVLLGLLIATLSGKHTTILLHQVVSEFDTLEANPVKRAAFSMLRHFFYHLVTHCATKVIVMEQYLKQQLSHAPNVSVIPLALFGHGSTHKRNEARKQLVLDQDKKIALYFGYIAPYKGIDTLVSNWPKHSTFELIVAGGLNPNHEHKTASQQFLATVQQLCAQKGIRVTGFVPEKEISLYFQAADVLILPYQTFMSSSGPLALAFEHELPVIFSKQLRNYTQSTDFARAMDSSHLKNSELFIPITTASLEHTLQNLEAYSGKYHQFIQVMKHSRALSRIASAYEKILIRAK